MNNTIKLPITGLQHIGIPVTDLKISEAFYSRIGFVKVMEKPFNFNGGKGICVMMKYDAMILELYQMPAHILVEVKSRKDGHIDHIAFDVTDIDETFRLLKENGFSTFESAPVFLDFWEKGCKYFNIAGPDGERLEFNQIM
jgi:catechol 2,3-dioxygenase-like lactoylglutathione lyase family enzyme